MINLHNHFQWNPKISSHFFELYLLAYFEEPAFYLSLCNLSKQDKLQPHRKNRNCESIALPEPLSYQRKKTIAIALESK